MKPFQFKQFSIQQSNHVFKVGTDGVLLGAASTVNQAKKILEVGTGTGLIALMLAQRNINAQVLAIDINENAVKLAAENFKNSQFNYRLTVALADYKNFNPKEKYDLIVSNPPYFAANESSKDIIARQQTELSFEILIEKSKSLLTKCGLLSVIVPFEVGTLFEEFCNKNQLYLQRRLQIYGILNSKPKRLLLEFGLEQQQISEDKLIIEKSPRQYSAEYLQLTEGFHQFSK